MTSLPPLFHSSAFRTSSDSRIEQQQSNIRQALNRMLEAETQLSTGYRVNVPSDDPIAASRSLIFRRQVEQGDQYLRNISIARSELEATDDALGAFSELVTRAGEVLFNAQNALNDEARNAGLLELDRLVREAVTIANRTHRGRFLFGGRDGSRPPAEFVGNFVNFTGSSESAEVAIGPGETVKRNMTGADSFGALSSEIIARADLDPRVTAATKLSDLNAGDGVRPGSVEISDGLGLVRTIDLTTAETVGDVLTLINADGVVTAAINAAQDGIALTVAGGDITVSEVQNGYTAADLGILQSSAGATLTGSDIDPSLRPSTLLADLLGGAGIDLSGLTINNGTLTRAVSLAGAVTVEDLLNAVNLANINVQATIDETATRINLQSSLHGARFTIAENGGTTAADLGLVIAFADLDIGLVNGGLGIQTTNGDDFQINLKDGTSFAVDVSNAGSTQDVVDLINNAPGNPGTLVASIPAGQTRLELVDSSGGSGDLSVSVLNGSFAAQTLGILQNVPDPATTLTGNDLDPAGHRADSAFDLLLRLREEIARGDSPFLEQLGVQLEDLQNQMIDSRSEIGVRVTHLNFAETRHEDQRVRFQTLISEEREVDLAEAVVDFEKNRALLEASYAVTSQILQLSLLDFVV